MLVDPIVLSWLLDFSARSYGGDYAARSVQLSAEARAHAQLASEERKLQQALQSEQAIAASQDVGRMVFALRPQAVSFALLGTLREKSASLGRALQRFAESMTPSLESTRRGSPSTLEELRAQLGKLEEDRWEPMHSEARPGATAP